MPEVFLRHSEPSRHDRPDPDLTPAIEQSARIATRQGDETPAAVTRRGRARRDALTKPFAYSCLGTSKSSSSLTGCACVAKPRDVRRGARLRVGEGDRSPPSQADGVQLEAAHAVKVHLVIVEARPAPTVGVPSRRARCSSSDCPSIRERCLSASRSGRGTGLLSLAGSRSAPGSPWRPSRLRSAQRHRREPMLQWSIGIPMDGLPVATDSRSVYGGRLQPASSSFSSSAIGSRVRRSFTGQG